MLIKKRAISSTAIKDNAINIDTDIRFIQEPPPKIDNIWRMTQTQQNRVL